MKPEPQIGIGAWATLIFLALAAGAGCARGTRSPAPGLSRFEFTQPQMGVPFRIVLYAATEAEADHAATRAFDRITRLNAILSDYDPESEVSRLCRETPPGTPMPVSPELWFVLERSQRLARETDGAFDVTVGPLVNLWRRSRRRAELPAPELLAEARARVGWPSVHLDERRRTVTFDKPGMRLDFGALGKGYAADEALRVLRELGINRALVAAAGDITVSESPPGQPGWRVEIGQIDLTNAPPPLTVWLRHAAVSTSGDLFQRLEIGGRRYSHILDPRTGIGLTDHSLVTVIAPDGITADSLDTAASVLGPVEGLALIEKTPRAAALVLRAPDGHLETFESRRLRRWTRPR